MKLTDLTPDRPTVLTIGKYDGVHIGHQHLLARMRRRAADIGAQTAALLLHPNPLAVLRPDSPVVYLATLEERVALVAEQGEGRGGMDSEAQASAQVTQVSRRPLAAAAESEVRAFPEFDQVEVGADLGDEVVGAGLGDLAREGVNEHQVHPLLDHQGDPFL